MVTLEFVKDQLYLDQTDTTQDRYLELLIKAATKHAETYMNRKLYDPKDVIPDTQTNGLHATEDIQVALMLLIGGWYENREEITDESVKSIPFGFKQLLFHYKYIPF